MPTRIIQNAARGESLAGIEPELLQQVDPGWRRRLTLYTGRALTDTALKNEQAYRSGRLALLGQQVTSGIASGLIAALDLSQAATPVLQVSPGYGFTAAGEDVNLPLALRAAFKDLPVIDSATGAVIGDFNVFTADAANNNFALIAVLQPIVGEATGQEINTVSDITKVAGDFSASCDRDPEEYAFEDWQIVEGARLVLVAWPTQPPALPLPVRAPDATWRNRIADAVFNAEAQLGVDQFLPWAGVGVPLGLIGFSPAWQPLFLDRAAVVRAGGLARTQRFAPQRIPDAATLTVTCVQQHLAEARTAQFLEQLLQPQTPLSKLAAQFVRIPASGLVPVAALDLAQKKNAWFPANWKLQAAPVHAEELETALRVGAYAEPLDLTRPESIEVLVPLPDGVYDPDILVEEALAPEFQKELEKATHDRDVALQHRKDLQTKSNVLLVANAQPALDLDKGLTDAEKTARDGAKVYTPTPADDFGTAVVAGALVSSDIQALKTMAAAAPYTVPGPNNQPLPLFSADDFKDLDSFGLQHFIGRINAKISKADDLVNLAFLRTQTDIYRYRQHVLGAADATRLATSPILANIASTDDSATVTTANLHTYLEALPAQKPTPPVTPAPAPTGTTGTPPSSSPLFSRIAGLRTGSVGSPFSRLTRPATPLADLLRTSASSSTVSERSISASAFEGLATPVVQPAPSRFISLSPSIAALTGTFGTAGTVKPTPAPSDVQNQSPLVGAQLDLRTLTVAERLKQSPSQEALFYSVANRTDVIQRLLADLEITVDDLPFLVHVPNDAAPTKYIVETHTIAELRQPANQVKYFALFQKAGLLADADEGSVFNAGIRTLEHHSLLLRAVEGRIQQYRDFLSHCQDALQALRQNLSAITSRLAQLSNDLTDARQNLALIASLLQDEQNRIAQVNARRKQIVQSAVTMLAFTRPRTLVTEADVPSRQLVPGNVVSPVPQCLQLAQTLPPELREMTALMREAPLNWFPAIEALLDRLERPIHLRELAESTQARAFMQSQMPVRRSAAITQPGRYSTAIGEVFTTNQNVMANLVAQRAALQAAQLYAQSWAAQRQRLAYLSAVADLLHASSVHLEISNATALLIQQIGAVAACLYDRVSRTLPVDRLAWAEYLRGPGRSVHLPDLAVLPRWNEQQYLDRQQMQLLCDWLFQQIDASNGAAVNYLSDLIRVAILLASHAPVNEIISGEVVARTLPVIDHVIRLTTPSQRVAHGMPVLLYQAGELTAQAVVEDLDGAGITARITNIHKPGVYLEQSAQAHFLNEPVENAALAKTRSAVSG